MKGKTAPQPRFSLGFIRDTWTELRKVVWPSRRDTTRLTILVLVVSIAVGLVLGALDLGFTSLAQGLLVGGG